MPLAMHGHGLKTKPCDWSRTVKLLLTRRPPPMRTTRRGRQNKRARGILAGVATYRHVRFQDKARRRRLYPPEARRAGTEPFARAAGRTLARFRPRAASPLVGWARAQPQLRRPRRRIGQASQRGLVAHSDPLAAAGGDSARFRCTPPRAPAERAARDGLLQLLG